MKGGSEPSDNYTFFYGNGDANHHYGQIFSYFRESFQQLRG
jgi:hypothetical protein